MVLLRIALRRSDPWQFSNPRSDTETVDEHAENQLHFQKRWIVVTWGGIMRSMDTAPEGRGGRIATHFGEEGRSRREVTNARASQSDG